MKPVIVTFAASGTATAERIAAATGGEVIADAKRLLPRLFAEDRPIIGVCAAGILIRSLAPHLSDKHIEPPVIAVSQDGAHVVPLLGGHRGANRLAREVASALGGSAALTTASESRFGRALDDPPEGWVLANPEVAKAAMAALLGGAAIKLTGDAPWLTDAGYPLDPNGAVEVTVTEKATGQGLVYHPRKLVAGIGGERGVDAVEVIELIEATISREGLSPRSLAALATLDIKSDEAAFHAAADHFGVPLRLFTAGELAAERDRLPNPSAIVEAETGTPGLPKLPQ